MTQHASLDEETWARHPVSRQILMIANEMNRARKFMTAQGDASRAHAYERILRLTDLTVRVRPIPALRRELLRWRDLVAELYVTNQANRERHDAALRCLLAFTAESYRQVAFLFPSPETRS